MQCVLNETRVSPSSVEKFFPRSVRSTKVFLSPSEFDNEIFLASLSEELRKAINSIKIEYTEIVFSKKTQVNTMFPKLEVLLALFLDEGLMTPEMKILMLRAVHRPSSPVRGEINRAYELGQVAAMPSDEDASDNLSLG